MKEEDNIKVHEIKSVCLTTNEFSDYLLEHNYNDNMFNPDGKLNSNYNCTNI